jgi:hypothetical protein
VSRHRNHNENSETEIGKPPGLIENLVWLKKNWGKHKALIAIGLLLIAVPIALDLGPRVPTYSLNGPGRRKPSAPS